MISYTPNKIEGELLGFKVWFYERTTRNVFSLLELTGENSEESEQVKTVYINAQVIVDSLKPHLETIRWDRRIRLRKKFSNSNLIKHLTTRQITEYAFDILEKLEGITIPGREGSKKKSSLKVPEEQKAKL